MFSDFSPSWDVLRRVAHVAMRKYAKSEKLAYLSASRVDTETADLFSSEKCKMDENGRPTVTTEVIEFVECIVNNIIAVSAFGSG